jgi:hypothetical protein
MPKVTNDSCENNINDRESDTTNSLLALRPSIEIYHTFMDYERPYQKLHLLSTFIIPHFLYATNLDVLPITTIRNMDSLIRIHAKDFLHLPASTPNGLLYSSKRDGGLGIPKLETLSISTGLKQGLTLLNTLDYTIAALLHNKRYKVR